MARSKAAVVGICLSVAFSGLIAAGSVAQSREQEAASVPTQKSKAKAKQSATATKPAARTQRNAAASAPKSSQKPYFVEFRARNAHNYGHTFLIHGRVGQKITRDDVVGLHPFTESPIPWMVGHLIAVPSETGASDGDIEDEYLLARFRVLLTEPEYRKAVASMESLKQRSPVWHALLYNCNAFVGDIAKSMGLRAPSSHLLLPEDFITELGRLNTQPQQAAAAVPSTALSSAARVD